MTLRRWLLALPLALLGLAAPLPAQQGGAAADSLWAAGEVDAAARLYEARLAADSADATALHRIALLRARNARYDQSLALFQRLVRLRPDDAAAALDRARVLAWSGDNAGAVRAVDELLARTPGDRTALEARAQFASWAGLYDESLTAYGQLLEITPGDAGLQQARARVLGWAGRYGAAAEAWQGLLQAAPTDTAALIGLGQALAWSGQYDSATVVFRRVLERDPGNLEALRSVARAASWSGDLARGEALWRDALAVNPRDVASLVGLGATLRWQGRDADARAVLRQAEAIAPDDADLREQLRWVRAALAPRVLPGTVYETDSDGNRIATATLAASWRPGAGRLEARAHGYLRRADQEGNPLLERRALGIGGLLSGRVGAGWVVTGGAGINTSDGEGAEPTLSLQASVASPAARPLRATLALSRSAFDATALLIQEGTVVEEVTLSAGAAPTPRWTLSASGAAARLTGDEINTRWIATGGAAYRLARPLTMGVATRMLGHAEDVADGYWDPDFYGVVELTGAWARDWARWSAGVEVAPGFQVIERDGEASASFRTSGRVGYLVRPGRQINLTLGYANSGLNQLSPGTAVDYRYRAVSLSGSWSF